MTALEDALAWQRDAACLGVDPDLFYPARGESTAEARAVCGECPVRDECLEYALANCETFGVWGGLGERDRRSLRRARKQVGKDGRGGVPEVVPAVMERFATRSFWTIPQLSTATGFADSSVNRAIRSLELLGRVELRGDRIGGARVWVLVVGDE